jgi:chemotaxis protein methyltransferase CheR
VREDELSGGDLKRLCKLIYDHSGIVISSEKKIMLEGRLKRRLSKLNLASYGEYCEFLFSGQAQDELIHLVDAVTTNKTDFFREKAHFDFLTAQALPEMSRSGHEVLVWSAGCSTGEEPYTLAMVLSQYASLHPDFRARVLATDISTAALAKAELGVFSGQVVRPVPPELRRKFFMRSRNPDSDLVRVVPELRALIEFRRLNLMEEFGIADRVDVIFCRNVIIYFDRPTQEKLFQRMSRQLKDGGYLFVGHSESLHHMKVPLTPVAPALYRRDDGRH